MTKLDVNMSGKKAENGEEKQNEEPMETQTLHDNQPVNNEEPATINLHTPTIMIGEIEITTETPNKQESQLVTFDWRIIQRVSISQMILSMIAMSCIMASIVSMGMDCYKFSQFVLSLYMLFTGYSGLKGSKKSYKHLIVYLIMSALQWMINVVMLGCLTYAVYDAPYYNYNIRYAFRSIREEDYGIGVGLLLTELFASGAMMGTVITGMLGLTACCKGFGRILTLQEEFWQSRRESLGQV